MLVLEDPRNSEPGNLQVGVKWRGEQINMWNVILNQRWGDGVKWRGEQQINDVHVYLCNTCCITILCVIQSEMDLKSVLMSGLPCWELPGSGPGLWGPSREEGHGPWHCLLGDPGKEIAGHLWVLNQDGSPKEGRDHEKPGHQSWLWL